jgi:hypothetical protein
MFFKKYITFSVFALLIDSRDQKVCSHLKNLRIENSLRPLEILIAILLSLKLSGRFMKLGTTPQSNRTHLYDLGGSCNRCQAVPDQIKGEKMTETRYNMISLFLKPV